MSARGDQGPAGRRMGFAPSRARWQAQTESGKWQVEICILKLSVARQDDNGACDLLAGSSWETGVKTARDPAGSRQIRNRTCHWQPEPEFVKTFNVRLLSQHWQNIGYGHNDCRSPWPCCSRSGRASNLYCRIRTQPHLTQARRLARRPLPVNWRRSLHRRSHSFPFNKR